jgi:Bacterial Ig domain
MKRNSLLAAIIVAGFALVLASPTSPAFAGTPFGSFGGQVGGGNVLNGSAPLFGWALADNGVVAVDVIVDGLIDGRAIYGRSRPGVTAMYPGFPNSRLPGWVYNLDTTHYLNGFHTVSARVRSAKGETADLKGIKFQFSNTPSQLQPFGKIEFPNAQAELTGDCGQTCKVGNGDYIFLDNPRRYSVVSGWALDAGVNTNDGGVGYVELLIDRALFSPNGYNSVTGCFFAPDTGGLTNCYGIRRQDISALFPQLRDSIHSGFRFVLDVSQLMNCGIYNPGHHTLTIRAGDQFGTVKEIAEIPVTFSCADFGTNDPSVGSIDVPGEGLLYKGQIQVTGWALDYQGVQVVTALVDGTAIGSTNVGLSRAGISALYPGYPNSVAPGFQIPFNTRLISNGQHKLQVIVTDSVGSDTLLGEVTFTVANVNQ